MKCTYQTHQGEVDGKSGRCTFYDIHFRNILEARDFLIGVPQGKYFPWHGIGIKDEHGNIYLRRTKLPGATFIDKNSANAINLEEYALLYNINAVRKGSRRRRVADPVDRWFGGI